MQSPIDSDRTYQIFKREADNTTVCIESVKGLQKQEIGSITSRALRLAASFHFRSVTQKTVEPSEPAATRDPLTP